jgi:hypothetical protein
MSLQPPVVAGPLAQFVKGDILDTSFLMAISKALLIDPMERPI